MASPTVSPPGTVPSSSGEPTPHRPPARLRDTVIGRKWMARGRSLRGSGGLRILAASAGGYAVFLAAAPRTSWWTAIIGLALIGGSLHGCRVKPALGLSFLAGATFYLPLLTWSNIYVGSVPWLGLSVLEASLVMPAGTLIAVASRRLPGWPFFAAAAWVFGEALRARFPFGGFPWGGIAFTQPDGPLLPAASLVGSAGLAFLTALAGFGLAESGRRIWVHRHELSRAAVRRSVLIGPVIALLVPCAIGGIGRTTEHSTAADPTETVAIVQGNVPRAGLDFNSQRRAVLDNHAARTHELAAAVRAGTAVQPSLVIWPENSSDIDPYDNPDAAQVINGAAADIGVPILVGAVVGAGPAGAYNMGIVWDPVTGPGQTYIKRHPVPFAEYMPWRPFFRFFSDKVDLLRTEFLPGDRAGNLDVAGVNVGDLICFEIVEDSLVRDVVNGGAQVLVVQTNNATFGYSNETWQQQAMSRVRAVEHGRQVLVVATSGVSAVIRADGSVESRIGLFTPGYLTPTVSLATATTPGTVLGGPVEWILTALTPLALLGALLWRRRRTLEPMEEPSL